jgi:hypothetical protein
MFRRVPSEIRPDDVFDQLLGLYLVIHPEPYIMLGVRLHSADDSRGTTHEFCGTFESAYSQQCACLIYIYIYINVTRVYTKPYLAWNGSKVDLLPMCAKNKTKKECRCIQCEQCFMAGQTSRKMDRHVAWNVPIVIRSASTSPTNSIVPFAGHKSVERSSKDR